MINTIHGRRFNVEFGPHDTIVIIKLRIQDHEGIPVSEQRFIFAGKQLEDTHDLADYNISYKAILSSIQRFRGC